MSQEHPQPLSKYFLRFLLFHSLVVSNFDTFGTTIDRVFGTTKMDSFFDEDWKRAREREVEIGRERKESGRKRREEEDKVVVGYCLLGCGSSYVATKQRQQKRKKERE